MSMTTCLSKVKFFYNSLEKMYLPPIRNFNKQTIIEFLKGTKHFQKLEQVRWIGKVRDFEELSTMNLTNIVNSDIGLPVKPYLPCVDIKSLDKTFLMNIVIFYIG